MPHLYNVTINARISQMKYTAMLFYSTENDSNVIVDQALHENQMLGENSSFKTVGQLKQLFFAKRSGPGCSKRR